MFTLLDQIIQFLSEPVGWVAASVVISVFAKSCPRLVALHFGKISIRQLFYEIATVGSRLALQSVGMVVVAIFGLRGVVTADVVKYLVVAGAVVGVIYVVTELLEFIWNDPQSSSFGFRSKAFRGLYAPFLLGLLSVIIASLTITEAIP
jgi:hypothetical protein